VNKINKLITKIAILEVILGEMWPRFVSETAHLKIYSVITATTARLKGLAELGDIL
jgi:hypothetical protein